MPGDDRNLYAGKQAGEKKSKTALPITDIILAEVEPKEKIEPLPPPKLKPLPPLQMATINAAPPRIVPNEQVNPEDVPPTQDDMDHVKLGTVNHPGALDDGLVAPPSNEGISTGVTVAPEKKDADDDVIWRSVEIEASYEGGPAAWQRFLIKNFHVPQEAISEETGGTVIVEFVVDKEGNVSNVQAISGPEVLRQEAVRVIKKSGKWNPGNQNGRKVNSFKRQPIVVLLQNE